MSFFVISICLYQISTLSYTDDNTPFAMGSSELEVINEIKTVSESLTCGFGITNESR